jgi:hypothetical protein
MDRPFKSSSQYGRSFNCAALLVLLSQLYPEVKYEVVSASTELWPVPVVVLVTERLADWQTTLNFLYENLKIQLA